MNRDHFPKAFVPEHLIARTIESLPLDTPVYVFPGLEDGFEPLNVYVMPDHSLHVRGSKTINPANLHPDSPLGQVGLMKVATVEGGQLVEGIVADLRFVENGQLLTVDDTPPADQEEFNEWLEATQDSIVISAFAAPEEEDEFKPKGKGPAPIYYGSPLFHGALERLVHHGDKRMKRFAKRAEKEGQKREQSEKVGKEAVKKSL